MVFELLPENYYQRECRFEPPIAKILNQAQRPTAKESAQDLIMTGRMPVTFEIMKCLNVLR